MTFSGPYSPQIVNRVHIGSIRIGVYIMKRMVSIKV